MPPGETTGEPPSPSHRSRPPGASGMLDSRSLPLRPRFDSDPPSNRSWKKPLAERQRSMPHDLPHANNHPAIPTGTKDPAGSRQVPTSRNAHWPTSLLLDRLPAENIESVATRGSSWQGKSLKGS